MAPIAWWSLVLGTNSHTSFTLTWCNFSCTVSIQLPSERASSTSLGSISYINASLDHWKRIKFSLLHSNFQVRAPLDGFVLPILVQLLVIYFVFLQSYILFDISTCTSFVSIFRFLAYIHQRMIFFEFHIHWFFHFQRAFVVDYIGFACCGITKEYPFIWFLIKFSRMIISIFKDKIFASKHMKIWNIWFFVFVKLIGGFSSSNGLGKT